MVKRWSLVALVALVLTACATAVPTHEVGRETLLVTQSQDAAFVRAQHAALHLGLRITETQEQAHSFRAVRPTGQAVLCIARPLGLGTLVEIASDPAHDVRDLVAAYHAER